MCVFCNETKTKSRWLLAALDPASGSPGVGMGYVVDRAYCAARLEVE